MEISNQLFDEYVEYLSWKAPKVQVMIEHVEKTTDTIVTVFYTLHLN